MLLVLLNLCFTCKSVPRPWKEAWVLMISKSYEWKNILTNTHSIALIETVHKILSKIFLDRISLACSTYDVLHGNNFSVLRDTITQSSIFVIGSVVKDVLKKNQELCLVLQDIQKTYDSVDWKHLRQNLIRIKIYGRFIRFFGSIHNSRVNRVMTDFGLTNGYHVYNELDQGKVFSPLLWHIFYDLLLCKIKKQESVCDYRLNSYFVSKSGHVESQTGLTLFLATGAFVNNTIWVGGSQATTQHILNVASEFFKINDISINNNKTVAILINCQISDSYLTVNNSPIFVAKKGELHYYLGIFLSSNGLSKPSLTKVHSNVWFFVNLVLRKAILDKQFAYLFLAGVLNTLYTFQFESESIPQTIFWLFCEFDVVGVNLLHVNTAHLFVYTDESLSNLGTPDMMAGAALFFENIDLGLSIKISGLVSSMMAKLQAIALALKCIPSSYSVDLFLDNQAVLNACRSKSMLAHLDFRNQYWVKHHYIINVICCKNLDVNWVKVKDYSGISSNKHTDVFVRAAAFFDWHLPHIINEHFFKAGGTIVFEVGSGSQIMVDSLHADIDWSRSSLVWHSDSYLAAGFISAHTTGLWSYFMKMLYYYLPVAVHKQLYNKCYPSVVCLFCGNVKISDHVFSCFFDAVGCAQLIEHHAFLLYTCTSDVVVSTALCKGFVFNKWYQKSLSVFKDFKIVAQSIVSFVHKFCLAFRDDIWLMQAEHWAIIEKSGLILCNDFIPVSVSGFLAVLLAGMVRLLGIANVFGISFGFYESCLFFLGTEDMVSVYINV
ncbi:hypothetical protein G9A89_014685 [Geosiphon pyriformis]|nr:hypothetical protein G9A89_014685 [Geosiphon pyriformis]